MCTPYAPQFFSSAPPAPDAACTGRGECNGIANSECVRFRDAFVCTCSLGFVRTVNRAGRQRCVRGQCEQELYNGKLYMCRSMQKKMFFKVTMSNEQQICLGNEYIDCFSVLEYCYINIHSGVTFTNQRTRKISCESSIFFWNDNNYLNIPIISLLITRIPHFLTWGRPLDRPLPLESPRIITNKYATLFTIAHQKAGHNFRVFVPD